MQSAGIEEYADFFVTGDEYLRKNLDLKFIPRAGDGEPSAVKFGLIGLAPCVAEEKVLEDYIKLCEDKGAKTVVVVLPACAAVKQTYTADAVKTFRDTINKVVNNSKAVFVDLLDVALAGNLFQDETHLNAEGKAAVTALLTVKLYLNGIISPQDLYAADDEFFNVFARHFPNDFYFPDGDKPLIQHVFCLRVCEDFNRLAETLPRETCLDLMARVFHELTYSYLACLAGMLPKDD